MTTPESAFAELRPAPNAAHPRQVLQPGSWYWKLLESHEAGALWSLFTSENPSIKTRKTRAIGQGSTAGEKGAWVLFEVTGSEPVIWTLPGLPSRAPQGPSTEYEDAVYSPITEPSGTELLDQLLGGLRTHLAMAGTVVLWGGTGILLWHMAQLTRKARP